MGEKLGGDPEALKAVAPTFQRPKPYLKIALKRVTLVAANKALAGLLLNYTGFGQRD